MEKDNQTKSRTQIKKEAEELQKLGVALIKLTRQQVERLALPEDLKTAVIDAQSIKSKIAGRRQRQFIGALMRGVDPEPIRRAMEMVDDTPPAQSESGKQVSLWLDRLLAGDSKNQEAFMKQYPGLDRQRLRQLVRNITNKKSATKPAKPLKALEQLIREAVAGR